MDVIKLKIQGTQETISPIEFNVDTVYIRTNIQRIETDVFSGWEYDEEQYNIKDYLVKMANNNLILSEENNLLRAQNEAISERSDFLEELIAEMAIMVYE